MEINPSGKTDTPSYQSIRDMVLTMGGSLDALAGIDRKDVIAENNVDSTSIDPDSKELYEKMISAKNMWLRRMFILCCILMGVIIAVLIYNLLNPMIGYIHH